jgi:hypothetical protein
MADWFWSHPLWFRVTSLSAIPVLGIIMATIASIARAVAEEMTSVLENIDRIF